MAGVFRFNGSNWNTDFNDTNQILRFNGSRWVKGNENGNLVINRMTGSGTGHTQIYPSPVVAGSKKVTANNNSLRNYKTGQSPNWQDDNDARQGFYRWRNPYSRYSGWTGIRRSSFNIAGLDTIQSATLTAKRNGSGYYNNNQTISFYGAAMSSASGNPFDLARNGAFTCTTGAPGKGRMMYNRAFSNLDQMKNWLTGVNGADGLILMNGETSASSYSANYLGISDISISISYMATGYSLRFEEAPMTSTFSLNRMPGVELININDKLYFIYLITDDEEYMTYEQIMNKREQTGEWTPTLSQAKLEGMVFDPKLISTKVITKDDGPYLEVVATNVDDKKVQVYSPRDGWLDLAQRITEEGPSEFVFELKLALDTDIFNTGDPKIRVSE